MLVRWAVALTRAVLIKGRVGYGSKRCRNNTCCCSESGVAPAIGGCEVDSLLILVQLLDTGGISAPGISAPYSPLYLVRLTDTRMLQCLLPAARVGTPQGCSICRCRG